MAVDTRQKRFSIMNFATRQTHVYPLFEADGSVDLDDRQHLLDCYSGIAFDNPAAVNVGPYYYLMYLGGQS